MRGLNISVAALAAFTGIGASLASAQISIPTVSIGNAGNAADTRQMSDGTRGYGSVAYAYNIGSTEVTNAQYAAFLNAKAASDPFGLYNGNGVSTNMAGSFGGITRSGSAGSYTYATVSGRESNPVNYVSFWDATRFANWLHNGQGSGDTETGAYTLTAGGISANTVTRNAGWQWAVTSENEWYKAAYHQPASAGGDRDNYWLYPTKSNAAPTTAQANYSGVGNTRPVGSYAANFYGTFDMGGNVEEWNESILSGGSTRGTRGGAYDEGSSVGMQAHFRNNDGPTASARYNGFRVSQIPGPGSAALLAIGGLGALRRRRNVGR
jgi:sulfatase modifying factor 1